MNSTAEIELLMNTALEIAQNQLEQNGGFFPFGLSIAFDHDDDDDEVDLLEASPDDEDAEIDEEEALDALVEVLGEARGDIRAGAVAFDAVIDDDWDAITVLVQHITGESVDVQLPYRTVGGERMWGEPEQTEGTLQIWS
jgi:hypothetical protein